MQIGNLGNELIFQISDAKIFTFQKLTRKVSGRWATHAIVGIKQKTEFQGADLQKITLKIELDASLGISPRKMLEKIEAMIEEGTAEILIIGNKTIGKNMWKILSASEEWEQILNGGELVRASVTLELEEYV